VKSDSIYPEFVYRQSIADMAAAIRAEQVELLCHAVPLSLLINVIVSTVVVSINWGVVPSGMLSGWLAAFAVLAGWRGWVVYQCRNSPPRNDAYWELRLSVGIIASGALWGLGAWMLFPLDSPVHQTFITVVLVGITGGAVTTLSGHRITSLLLVLLVLIPLVVRWFTLGGTIAMITALLIIMLGGVIVLSALRVRRTLVQNIRLRIDAALCDDAGRPWQNIRIKRTHILDDPFPDPPGLAELVVIQGFDLAPGESFRLSSESVLLGRSATCGLPLNDPAVSMEHAQIARHGNRYFVTDLNSTNGTWVNDQKLTGPTYLVDGDTVAVGDTVFRFQELRTPPPDEHRSYR